MEAEEGGERIGDRERGGDVGEGGMVEVIGRRTMHLWFIETGNLWRKEKKVDFFFSFFPFSHIKI